MGRLARSQLRFRAARTVALLAGVFLAATAFTVLTGASQTSQLRTIGTVTAHFRPAYDILVRPKGSRTALEARTGTVQPNFLSGIYGGISLAQYHKIQQIPGVQVAAPIAMIGYTLIRAGIPVELPAADNARPGRQLYRYTTTWVSAGGTTRVVQPSSYLYLTPGRLGLSSAGETYEILPGGSRVTVCPQPDAQPSSPFGAAAQSVGWCWSQIDGNAGAFTLRQPAHRPFAIVNWSSPMLIAAIDPAAEAKLDGFNLAVTSGRYLRENDRGQRMPGRQPAFPVLAASSSGIGEYAVTQVQRLPAPSAPVSLRAATMARQAEVPGQTVLTVRTTAEQAYRQVLAITRNDQPVDEYLTAGPVGYRRAGRGTLTPVQVRNPISVWQPGEATSALLAPPMDETETQYRSLGQHVQTGSLSTGGSPEMQLVGVFDPAKVRAFDPLSRVPLGPFQPTVVAPANAVSRNGLGGGDLLPNLNLGGYVAQPAQLITTLSALPVLDSSSAFSGNTHASDPISVIRVRVAGVTGPNPVSLERIREVAQQIAVGTGLDVDIVAGSSPEPVTIDLPAGSPGQPNLDLTEGWVKKGIAVAILNAVDKKSVVLFTLILVVCMCSPRSNEVGGRFSSRTPMTVTRLDRVEARRIAVRAQLLDAGRPTDLLAVVNQLTLLQLDPTAAVAPSADLVAWARLGAAYQPVHLQQALDDRALFEYRAMVRPMTDLGLYLAEMAAWPAESRRQAWLEANESFRRYLLDLLRARGPLLSRDVPDRCVVPWPSTGWTNNRNVTQMLESLAARGQIAVSGRSGRQRLWDLAERVYPAGTPVVPTAEALRRRGEKRLRSLGIARASLVGEAGEPAEVEGTPGVWRVDPPARGQPFAGRTALLSPFDQLVYDRQRALELFDFEYRLEMYVPKAKRRWGYFALPVVYHDQLIGKVDATADRKKSVLQVHAIHQDIRFTRPVTAAVHAELEALASWLGLAAVSGHGRPGSRVKLPPGP